MQKSDDQVLQIYHKFKSLGLLEYIDGALTVSHATGMNVAEVAVSVAKVTVDIIEASAPHKPADHNDLA